MVSGHAAPWLGCLECRAPITISQDRFSGYFSGAVTPCANCGAEVDWYRAVEHWIADNFMLTGVFSAVGATTTLITLELRPNEVVELNLIEHGVPATATVVSINYTPEGTGAGGIMPLEVFGNTPPREAVPLRINLFGRPFGESPATCRLNVAATWTNSSTVSDVATRHFTDAARQYAARRFDAVVIPANIAVESALTPAVFDIVSRFCGNQRAESFLSDAATYGHQLNVLLPMFACVVPAPEMPAALRGQLNRLRQLRNTLAHEGRLEGSLANSDAAALLTASLFGFHYAGVLRSATASAVTAGRLPGAVTVSPS